MSARTRLAEALALIALGVSGCTSSSAPTDAGLDATADVGVRDTGMRDSARPDTSIRDTGPADTGTADASDSGVADPGWVPMPGLPDGCVFERAEHPERVFTPEWRTEPSCGPGCVLPLKLADGELLGLCDGESRVIRAG